MGRWLGPGHAGLVALDWVRTLIGLPAGCEGVLVSGKSMANFTALEAARHDGGPGVAYLLIRRIHLT